MALSGQLPQLWESPPLAAAADAAAAQHEEASLSVCLVCVCVCCIMESCLYGVESSFSSSQTTTKAYQKQDAFDHCLIANDWLMMRTWGCGKDLP